VGVPAEQRRAVLGVVTPDALEDAGPVVKPVCEDVDLGVLPVHELAVHPDGVDVHLVKSHMNSIEARV